MRASTRAAIREKAKEMGYPLDEGVLKRAARGRGDSEFRPRVLMPMVHVLREVFFDPERSYSYQEFVAGIRERIERNNGIIEVPTVDTVEEVMELARRQRFTGLVIRQPLPQAWMEKLHSLAPMVMAGPHNHYSRLGIDAVHWDEGRAAAKVVDHLHSFGHRHIAWWGILDKGGLTENIRRAINLNYASDRLIPSSHTLRFGAWANLALCQPSGDQMPMLLTERNRDEKELGVAMEEGMDQLLALRPRPTAVVVASESMSNEVLRICAHRRIRIPQDLSLVTYGTSKDDPAHSTRILSPFRLFGQTVFEVLERRLAMPSAVPIMLLIQSQLVPGKTVARPPADPDKILKPRPRRTGSKAK